MDEDINPNRDLAGGSAAIDLIEVRVPPKAEFRSVLRATIGAIAVVMSFNYDEIMELRIAVSEAFDLVIHRLPNEQEQTRMENLTVRFRLKPGQIEFLVAGWKDYASHERSQEEKESIALLRSLVDEVEFGAEVDGQRVIRAVKNRSSQ